MHQDNHNLAPQAHDSHPLYLEKMPKIKTK